MNQTFYDCNYRIGNKSYDHYLTTDDLRDLRQYQKQFHTIKVLGTRAMIIDDNGIPTLLSYKTKVARVVDGELVRLWNNWSATTAVHVANFCKEYNLRAPSKAEWLSMPIGG